MSTPTVALGDVCDINPPTDFQFEPEDACTFVPMEAVDEGDARIARAMTKPFRQVSKGYTPFAENDVIVAKITPCMENGKCAIGRNLRSGVAFGSTEFHVLRGTKHVIPEWLYYFWRFPQTRTLASLNMTGSAGQKRVPTSFLETARIPLPDLPEQRRIAARLEQVDRLRRTRRYALELTDTFLPSAFIELFSEYFTPESPGVLNDVLAGPLSNGFFGKSSVYGAGVPIIWVDNLYHTVTINMENLRRARVAAEQVDDYRVIEGDLLFTRSSLVREGIGQINIVPHLPEPALFECHVIRARVDRGKVNPFYVLGLYRSSFGKAQILRRANTATMTTISQSALEQLPCPLPPLPLQQKFAALVERVERLRGVQREALRQAEHLFASLLHRAFGA